MNNKPDINLNGGTYNNVQIYVRRFPHSAKPGPMSEVVWGTLSAPYKQLMKLMGLYIAEGFEVSYFEDVDAYGRPVASFVARPVQGNLLWP